jgi:hypothetical protein
MLVDNPEYHQLIFVGSAQRVDAFTHSGAFVRRTVRKKGKQVVVVGFQQQEYDANTNMPDNVVELAEAIEFHRDFALYQEMDLYAIKGRVVSNLEAKKILQDVEWVIAGQKIDAKAVHVKHAKGAHIKKGCKGWKYGGDDD